MAQWSKGNCCEDFFPLGPALVVGGVTDPQVLGLRCLVNGELHQSSTTADMIFGVATTIQTLSQFMVLSPGDIHQHRHTRGSGLVWTVPLFKTR